LTVEATISVARRGEPSAASQVRDTCYAKSGKG
jgi:hypothetical protein